jgi:hypothetical protein
MPRLMPDWELKTEEVAVKCPLKGRVLQLAELAKRTILLLGKDWIVVSCVVMHQDARKRQGQRIEIVQYGV